tara:strand:+ start:260 stop:835 length:576 start_codon:yes stop_codon:yes gene_type:complete
MNFTKKIYLLICLFPLIFVVSVSALNFNKPQKIRILTWTSPSLNIGYLTSLSSAIGFIYGSLTILSLNNKPISFKNKVVKKVNKKNDIKNELYSKKIEEDINNLSSFYDNENFIERDPRESPPTLTVPFRIINKKSKITQYDELDRIDDQINDINQSDQPNTENIFNNNGFIRDSEENLEDWHRSVFLEEW